MGDVSLVTEELQHSDKMESDVADKEDDHSKKRRRKRRRPYSPEIHSPAPRSRNRIQRKRSSKTRNNSGPVTDQPFDVLPDGKPFRCDLCQSPYMGRSPASRRGRPSKQAATPCHKPDPKTGRVLLLCHPCGALAGRKAGGQRPRETASPEEKEKYLTSAQHTAQALATEFCNADAERLFCPTYNLSPCGCLQKFIAGETDEDEEKRGGRVQRLLMLMSQAKELSQQKCYAITPASQRCKNRKIGLGNGHKRSREFEEFVLRQRETLKKEMNLCERATQKVLHYSNNFLHKRLKTEESGRRRAQRVHGKAELGKIIPLTELAKHHCCLDNCVRLVPSHPTLVRQWRDRVRQGQKETRRVLAEMLTPAGGMRSNCYKFISMVTGCSFSTIARVNERMQRTGGDREPPLHGLVTFLQHNPRSRASASSKPENKGNQEASRQAPEGTATTESVGMSEEGDALRLGSEAKPSADPQQPWNQVQRKSSAPSVPAAPPAPAAFAPAAASAISIPSAVSVVATSPSCITVAPPVPSIAGCFGQDPPSASRLEGAVHEISTLQSLQNLPLKIIPISLPQSHGGAPLGVLYGSSFNQGSVANIQGPPTSVPMQVQGSLVGGFGSVQNLQGTFLKDVISSQGAMSCAPFTTQGLQGMAGKPPELIGLQGLGGAQFTTVATLGSDEVSRVAGRLIQDHLVGVPGFSNNKEQLITIIQADSLMKNQEVFTVSTAANIQPVVHGAEYANAQRSTLGSETLDRAGEPPTLGQQVTALIQETVGSPSAACLVSSGSVAPPLPVPVESQPGFGVIAGGTVPKGFQILTSSMVPMSASHSASLAPTAPPPVLSSSSSSSVAAGVGILGSSQIVVTDANGILEIAKPPGLLPNGDCILTKSIVDALTASQPAGVGEKATVQFLVPQAGAPAQAMGANVGQFLPPITGPAVLQLMSGGILQGGTPGFSQLGLGPGPVLMTPIQQLTPSSIQVIASSASFLPQANSAAVPVGVGTPNTVPFISLNQNAVVSGGESFTGSSVLLPMQQQPAVVVSSMDQQPGVGSAVAQEPQSAERHAVVAQGFTGSSAIDCCGPVLLPQVQQPASQLGASEAGHPPLSEKRNQVVFVSLSSPHPPASSAAAAAASEAIPRQGSSVNAGSLIIQDQAAFQLVESDSQGQLLVMDKPAAQGTTSVGKSHALHQPDPRAALTVSSGCEDNEHVKKLVDFAFNLQPLVVAFGGEESPNSASQGQSGTVQGSEQSCLAESVSSKGLFMQTGTSTTTPSNPTTATSIVLSQNDQLLNPVQTSVVAGQNSDLVAVASGSVARSKSSKNKRASKTNSGPADGQPPSKKSRKSRQTKESTEVAPKANKKKPQKTEGEKSAPQPDVAPSTEHQPPLAKDALVEIVAMPQQSVPTPIVINLNSSQDGACMISGQLEQLQKFLAVLSQSGPSLGGEAAAQVYPVQQSSAQTLNLLLPGDAGQQGMVSCLPGDLLKPASTAASEESGSVVGVSAGPGTVHMSGSLSQLPIYSISSDTSSVQTLLVEAPQTAAGLQAFTGTRVGDAENLRSASTALGLASLQTPGVSFPLQPALTQVQSVGSEGDSGGSLRGSERSNVSIIKFAQLSKAGEIAGQQYGQISKETTLLAGTSSTFTGGVIEHGKPHKSAADASSGNIRSSLEQGLTVTSSHALTPPRISFQVGPSFSQSAREQTTKMAASHPPPHGTTKTAALNLPTLVLDSPSTSSPGQHPSSVASVKSVNIGLNPSSAPLRIQIPIPSSLPASGKSSVASAGPKRRKLLPGPDPGALSPSKAKRLAVTASYATSVSSLTLPSSIAPQILSSGSSVPVKSYSAVTHIPFEQLLSAVTETEDASAVPDQSSAHPNRDGSSSLPAESPSQVEFIPDLTTPLHIAAPIEELGQGTLGSGLDRVNRPGRESLVTETTIEQSFEAPSGGLSSTMASESSQNVVIHHLSVSRPFSGGQQSSGWQKQAAVGLASSRSTDQSPRSSGAVTAESPQGATIHHHSKSSQQRGRGLRGQSTDVPESHNIHQRSSLHASQSLQKLSPASATNTGNPNTVSSATFHLGECFSPPNTVAPLQMSLQGVTASGFQNILPLTAVSTHPGHQHQGSTTSALSSLSAGHLGDSVANVGPPNTIAPPGSLKKANKRSHSKQQHLGGRGMETSGMLKNSNPRVDLPVSQGDFLKERRLNNPGPAGSTEGGGVISSVGGSFTALQSASQVHVQPVFLQSSAVADSVVASSASSPSFLGIQQQPQHHHFNSPQDQLQPQQQQRQEQQQQHYHRQQQQQHQQQQHQLLRQQQQQQTLHTASQHSSSNRDGRFRLFTSSSMHPDLSSSMRQVLECVSGSASMGTPLLQPACSGSSVSVSGSAALVVAGRQNQTQGTCVASQGTPVAVDPYAFTDDVDFPSLPRREPSSTLIHHVAQTQPAQGATHTRRRAGKGKDSRGLPKGSPAAPSLLKSKSGQLAQALEQSSKDASIPGRGAGKYSHPSKSVYSAAVSKGYKQQTSEAAKNATPERGVESLSNKTNPLQSTRSSSQAFIPSSNYFSSSGAFTDRTLDLVGAPNVSVLPNMESLSQNTLPTSVLPSRAVPQISVQAGGQGVQAPSAVIVTPSLLQKKPAETASSSQILSTFFLGPLPSTPAHAQSCDAVLASPREQGQAWRHRVAGASAVPAAPTGSLVPDALTPSLGGSSVTSAEALTRGSGVKVHFPGVTSVGTPQPQTCSTLHVLSSPVAAPIQPARPVPVLSEVSTCGVSPVVPTTTVLYVSGAESSHQNQSPVAMATGSSASAFPVYVSSVGLSPQTLPGVPGKHRSGGPSGAVGGKTIVSASVSSPLAAIPHSAVFSLAPPLALSSSSSSSSVFTATTSTPLILPFPLALSSPASSCTFSFPLTSSASRSTAAVPGRGTSDVIGHVASPMPPWDEADHLDAALVMGAVDSEVHAHREPLAFTSRSRNSSGDLNMEQFLSPDLLLMLQSGASLPPPNTE